MNRSASHSMIGYSRYNQDLTRKLTYINEQMPKKNEKTPIQTIFHSPYKDGRPNKDYFNPTFMSSDIISSRDFSPFAAHTPKKAVIHTEAENRQKALYNQRMNRSQSFTSIAQRVRQSSKSLRKKANQREQMTRGELRGEQGKNTKMIFNSTLQNELEGLIHLRQQRELKESNRELNDRFFRKTQKKQNDLPVYLQKYYQNPHYVDDQQDKKKSELKEWLGLSKQLQNIKDQIKKEKLKIEASHLQRNIENYQVAVQEKELVNRENAKLLNKILLEQIKAKQKDSHKEKKEKGWRAF